MVAEADVVAVHAGRLAPVPRIHLVAAETGISRLHAGELQKHKSRVVRAAASVTQNKRDVCWFDVGERTSERGQLQFEEETNKKSYETKHVLRFVKF